MPKMTPCLWFDDNAEEAVNYYLSVFKNSAILNVSRYSEGGMGEPGKVMVINFSLDGQEYMALNGGPVFNFTEAVSFYVHCDTQAEIDWYWEKLSAHPEAEQCGWCKDQFGLSWQIVPNSLGELMGGSAEQAGRVMQALLQMKKLDIAALTRARDAG